MQSSVSTSSADYAANPAGDHAAADALGLWEPKRSLTLEAARRHTARIRVLRRLLLLTAVVLAGGVVWQFLNQPRGFDLLDNPNETVRMVNPKYSGRTNDGLPYFLTAAEAVRNAAASTAVNLSLPILDFYREPGAQASKVTAMSGLYDDMENILNLEETVKLGTDDGYSCETDRAKIFTKDKRLSGDAPIACSGSFGDVNGNSFTITQDYKVFTFADGMNASITRSETDNSEGALGFEGNDPINIKAVVGTYKSAVTTLSGDVDVRQAGSRVTSDNMVIYRAKAKESEGSLKLGPITKIEAQGNFVYTTADRHLSGNRGVYEREKDIITVTGNVVLKQGGGNNITGDKLVYDLARKKARVGDDCRGENCGRVNFQYSPDRR